jgi:hypothetical protein
MQKITSRAALQSHIQYLEQKQIVEWDLVKSTILVAREELRPVNIIKSTFREMTVSSTGKQDLLAAVIGAAAGVLSKTVVFGFSHNPIKKVVGTLLQFKVANIVANQAENINRVSSRILEYLKKRMIPSSKKDNNFH